VNTDLSLLGNKILKKMPGPMSHPEHNRRMDTTQWGI